MKPDLMKEAERCWLEGIGFINRGKALMERAYSLREKAWEGESNEQEQQPEVLERVANVLRAGDDNAT